MNVCAKYQRVNLETGATEYVFINTRVDDARAREYINRCIPRTLVDPDTGKKTQVKEYFNLVFLNYQTLSVDWQGTHYPL